MLFRILLSLAAISCSLPSLADTVWLKNGDRLSGTIKFYDSGKLLLKTDYAGEIPLDWSKVATLESDRPLLVKFRGDNQEHSQGLKQAEPGKVLLVNGTQRNVALADIRQLMPPKPLIEDWLWSGRVDLALDQKRAEKDIDKYDIDFKTTARHGRWRHNLKGEYNREVKDDKVGTNNYSGEYALDRFLDDHWFWQGKAEYQRDTVSDLKTARTLGTGPGYQFWDNELGAFSLATLINRNDYEFTPSQKINFYSASLKWDYKRYLLAKQFEIFTEGELERPRSEELAIDYVLESKAGLRYRLTSWASLSLRAEWEKLSSDYGDVDERRYVLGMGVNW